MDQSIFRYHTKSKTMMKTNTKTVLRLAFSQP